MVYCTKCGTKNEDNAKTCSQCGASLYATRERPEYYRRMEDECFGIPKGGTVVGIFIGLVVMIAGLSLLLQQVYNISLPWWPFVVIFFGILLITGAIYRGRRRY